MPRTPAVAAPLSVLLALAFVAPPAAADHAYDQPVWFEWYEWDLDVLVTGVDDPIVGDAIVTAIEAWRTGIAQLAPPRIADNLTFDVYFPARDPVPPPGFDAHGVDIMVVPQGFLAWHTGSSGIRCYATAPFAGYGLASSYRVAAHEFGHCLGLGHVFQHGVEYSPGFDVMGNGAGHPCPSNLNILVLERVFWYLGGDVRGGTVTLPSSDYFQATC